MFTTKRKDLITTSLLFLLCKKDKREENVFTGPKNSCKVQQKAQRNKRWKKYKLQTTRLQKQNKKMSKTRRKEIIV